MLLFVLCNLHRYRNELFRFLFFAFKPWRPQQRTEWPVAILPRSRWSFWLRVCFKNCISLKCFVLLLFFFVISIHSSVSFECKCKCVEVHFTIGIHETKQKTGKKKAPQRTQFIHACIQVVSDLSARVLFVVEHFETKSMKRLEEFVSNYEWFAAQTRSFTMTTQLVATNYLPKMYRNARQ